MFPYSLDSSKAGCQEKQNSGCMKEPSRSSWQISDQGIQADQHYQEIKNKHPSQHARLMVAVED